MNRTRFHRRRRSPLATVLWVNAVLLAGILGVMIARNGPSLIPSALAQQLNNIGGGGGVYVIPAQFSSQQWGCYLIDIDQQTLVAYEFQGGEKQLKFVAARSFKYDRRLGNYSTFPPPAEVKRLVEREAAAEHKAETVTPAPQPPPPTVTPVTNEAPKDDGHTGDLPAEPH